MLRKERQVSGKQTGGAVLHYVTNQSVGMRKGSALVRRVAPKSSCAILVVGGCVAIRRHWSRNMTDYSARGKVHGVLYCVEPKLYAATGAAHRSRLK